MIVGRPSIEALVRLLGKHRESPQRIAQHGTAGSIGVAHGATQVVVVGGGILGASVAWHLARLGASVTVLEKGSEPACGVTRWSYGWVGTGSVFPSDDPAGFGTKMESIDEFAALESALGFLPIAARGALVWHDTEEGTSKLITEQQAAGVRMETLDRARVRELEPHFAVPPALAAWAPDDFALEPIDLTCQLLAAAREAGADVVFGTTVETIETLSGRVVGVRTKQGPVPAGTVVLANAASAVSLVAGLGMVLPIRSEPAVLMRFSAQAGIVRHLLCGQGLEVRPGRAGDLVLAEDYPNEGRASFADLARRTAATIARMFATSPAPSLLSINAAHRPMTEDGSPLRTFLTGVEGLYAVIAHPGVVLAPRLGRLAADEIMASAR